MPDVAASQELMEAALALFGVSKRQMGLLLGADDGGDLVRKVLKGKHGLGAVTLARLARLHQMAAMGAPVHEWARIDWLAGTIFERRLTPGGGIRVAPLGSPTGAAPSLRDHGPRFSIRRNAASEIRV